MIRVYYHDDLDGQCAAAIINYIHNWNRDGNILFEAVDYSFDEHVEHAPFVDTIYMLDYSLQPIERMARLRSKCNKLYWIDHHKSVKQALMEYNARHVFPFSWEGTLDTDLFAGRAGCELTWYYTSLSRPVPEAVTLLGLYDTWRYTEEPPDIREKVLNFQYGMRSYSTGPTDPIWESLLPLMSRRQRKHILGRGTAVRQYEDSKTRREMKNAAHTIYLGGLKFLAVNTQTRGSLQFEHIWAPANYDGMMAYSWTGDHWTVRMYTDKPEIDLSIIAKRHGGGGHAQAAGCHLKGLILT